MARRVKAKANTTAKSKAKAAEPEERRGFNGSNATVRLVLVEAAVGEAASAVKKYGGCATWRKDVYGVRVRATRQSYMVYRLEGHGWSVVQSVSGPAATHRLAQWVSRELGGRTIWLCLSDVASWTGYYVFDRGTMTEILEDYAEHHGDTSHLPQEVVGSLKSLPTGRGIFGSSAREVALSKLKTGIGVEQFIDSFFKSQNILAPVSGDWREEPRMVTLELPQLEELADEDVERMDFVGGGPVSPATQ